MEIFLFWVGWGSSVKQSDEKNGCQINDEIIKNKDDKKNSETFFLCKIKFQDVFINDIWSKSAYKS